MWKFCYFKKVKFFVTVVTLLLYLSRNLYKETQLTLLLYLCPEVAYRSYREKRYKKSVTPGQKYIFFVSKGKIFDVKKYRWFLMMDFFDDDFWKFSIGIFSDISLQIFWSNVLTSKKKILNFIKIQHFHYTFVPKWDRDKV